MNDAVRLRPTGTLPDLDALVNERCDVPLRALRWLAAMPWMDNGMVNFGHDLSHMVADQVISCPREDSNLR